MHLNFKLVICQYINLHNHIYKCNTQLKAAAAIKHIQHPNLAPNSKLNICYFGLTHTSILLQYANNYEWRWEYEGCISETFELERCHSNKIRE